MLLIYIILAYSHTNIITQSEIFKPIRDWADKNSHFLSSLFSCPMCMGFWVGVFWTCFNISPTLTFFSEMDYVEYLKYLTDGIISSGCAWIIHNTVSLMMDIKNAQKGRILELIEEMEGDGII